MVALITREEFLLKRNQPELRQRAAASPAAKLHAGVCGCSHAGDDYWSGDAVAFSTHVCAAPAVKAGRDKIS